MPDEDDVGKALERIEKYVLIAVQSSSVEEARTAAHNACKLIHKHGLRVVQGNDALPGRKKGSWHDGQKRSMPYCSVCGQPAEIFASGACIMCFLRGSMPRSPPPPPRRAHEGQKKGTARRICKSCAAPISWDSASGLCRNCCVFVSCDKCNAESPYGTSNEDAVGNARRAGFRNHDGVTYCPACFEKYDVGRTTG